MRPSATTWISVRPRCCVSLGRCLRPQRLVFHLPRAELGCAGAQEIWTGADSWSSPRTTIRWATGVSGTGPTSSSPRVRWPAGQRCCCSSPFTPLLLPRARSGHENGLSCSSTDHEPELGRLSPRVAGRVPEPRLGGDLRTRSAIPDPQAAVHLREQQAGLVRNWMIRPTRGCSPGTGG